MIKNLAKRVILSISISVLILTLLALYADFRKIAISLKIFQWHYIILVLTLSLLNYLFRFFRWEIYLKKLGIKISTSESILIFMSGFTMSITPGKVGETLKSYLLKVTKDVPISRSVSIVVIERLMDFIALVILALYGSFYFNYYSEVVAGTGLAIIGGILIISKREIFSKILEQVSKAVGEKLATKVNTTYNSIVDLIEAKILISSILISILSWFFECLGLYIVIRAYSIDFSLNLATFIYSFATIAGAVSMLPGGIGPTEGSITGLLLLNEIPKDIAVAITIIIRFATLWFAVFLGLLSLFILQKKIGKIEND